MGSLRLDGLTVRAGGRTLLDAIELVVHPGELCALVGPSGAGKSTLMKSVLGLRSPSDGRVRLGEGGVSSAGPLGYVPQDDALHGVLTVRKSLDYTARLRLPELSEEDRMARIEETVRRVGLSERLDLRIGKLSGGQRKRVSVAMELLTAPPVLVLDEPTSGLDPGMEAHTMGLFAELAHEGRIVIVATHAMASMHLCDVVVVLVAGRLAYAGAPEGCPEWFGAADMNGIFPAIDRRAPPVWARSWQQSEGHRQALTRPRPSATRRPTPASEPEPECKSPPSPASERPSAEEQLAALKAQLGKSS